MGSPKVSGLCIGDYNEVFHPHEHVRAGLRRSIQIAGFREAMNVCALDDVGPEEEPANLFHSSFGFLGGLNCLDNGKVETLLAGLICLDIGKIMLGCHSWFSAM